MNHLKDIAGYRAIHPCQYEGFSLSIQNGIQLFSIHVFPTKLLLVYYFGRFTVASFYLIFSYVFISRLDQNWISDVCNFRTKSEWNGQTSVYDIFSLERTETITCGLSSNIFEKSSTPPKLLNILMAITYKNQTLRHIEQYMNLVFSQILTFVYRYNNSFIRF